MVCKINVSWKLGVDPPFLLPSLSFLTLLIWGLLMMPFTPSCLYREHFARYLTRTFALNAC